ncbi:unnamed protein product [Rotaria magnacalcarata]
MYASNEDEDWAYLHGTSPKNSILHKAVNIVDSEQPSSSSLSSYSSRSSSSSKLDPSVSLSSISSTELEHTQKADIIIRNDNPFSYMYNLNNYHDLEEEIDLLEATNNEHSLLLCHNDNNTQTVNINNRLSTDGKKQIRSSQANILHDNDNSKFKSTINKSQEMNKNHVFNSEFKSNTTESRHNRSSLSDGSRSSASNIRCPSCFNVAQTAKCQIVSSIPMSEQSKLHNRIEGRQHNNNISISCIYIIVFFTLPIMLGHFVTRWDQSTITKIVDELTKMNQRLNGIKYIPLGNIQEKLTKQFEEKLQNIISEQSAWHDHEKYTLSLQIQELRQILKITQQNLTNTIHQLTQENEQLQEQIQSLEHPLGRNQEQNSKFTKTCIQGANCTKPTLNKSVTTASEEIPSIAADTSVNLLGFFESLSASLSNIVDHRHEYIEKSKKKLIVFAGSSSFKTIRTSFRRGFENLSSSFYKVQLTYTTWLESRAKQRDQNRIVVSQKEKQRQSDKKPRSCWPFQYGFNRDRRWCQVTNKDHSCHSKSNFLMDKICSMKRLLVKFFRL